MFEMAEKITKRVSTLPTLPTVFSKLNDIMTNPRATTGDVARIISSDQASSVKLLKVVNSPFYGFSGRIDTISQAIMHLGFEEVRNIVLALSVINLFSRSKLILNFRPVDFWGHSIGVGVSARLIAKSLGITKVENFFLGGVLHDIGKLVLFNFAEEEYEKVLRYVNQNRISIYQAERELLKTDHTEVGLMLAEKWKLPVSIKNFIAYHHSVNLNGKPDVSLSILHLADIVARVYEFGYPGDDFIPRPDPALWDTIKLPAGTLELISDQLVENFESTSSMILTD